MHGAASTSSPRSRPRRVLIVGGLTRLEREYRCCATDEVTVEVANTNSARLGESVSHADAIVVIVPNVSHAAVQSVRRHARRLGLRVVHARSPSARHVSERISEIYARH
ncbi:MAG: DUF2325 domain-containing protein [Polyangiaceae bacterium]